MTASKRGGGGSQWLFVGSRFLTVLLDLLPSVIMARVLSRNEYGTYLQCFLILQSLSVVLCFGIPKGIAYFGATSANRRNDILNCLLAMAALAAVGSLPLALAPGTLAAAFRNPDLAGLAGLLWVSLVLRTVNIAVPFVFIALERVREASLLGTGKSLLTFGLMAGVCWLAPSVRNLLLAYAAPEAGLAALMAYRVLGIREGGRFAPDPALLRKVAGYSLPLALGGLVMVASNRLDQYLISFLFRPEEFAVYARGAMELPVTAVLTVSLSNLITPRLVKAHRAGDAGAFVAEWHEAIRKVVLISYPLAVYFLVYAEPFITFLYTDQYAESSRVFAVYVAFIFLQFSSLDNILQSLGLTRPVFLVAVATVAVNLAAGTALIPAFSYLGPALGLAAALGVSTFCYLSLIRGALSIPWTALLPWGILGRVVGCNLVLFGALFAFDAWTGLGHKFTRLAVGGAVAAGLYATLLYGLGWLKFELRPVSLGGRRVGLPWPRLGPVGDPVAGVKTNINAR